MSWLAPWVVPAAIVLGVIAWGVYEFFWGECDCDACNYMASQGKPRWKGRL